MTISLGVMLAFGFAPAWAIDFSGASYRVKKSGETVTAKPTESKSPQTTEIQVGPVPKPSGTVPGVVVESSPIKSALPPNGEVTSIRELLQLAPKRAPKPYLAPPAPVAAAPQRSTPMVEEPASFEMIAGAPESPEEPNQGPPAPPVNYVNHVVLDDLLKKYISKSNWVNYRGILQNKEVREELEFYVRDLSALDPSTLTDQADKVASWLNLYNAIVLNEVLKVYPIQNMMKIRNFFGEKKYKIGERVWSLMEIEEEIFVKEIMDPRTVFARVNGSSSGPRFMKEAFDPRRLDAQLEERTWTYLTDPANVRFEKKRLMLFLSATFLWYEKELIDVNAFLRNYLNLLPKYFQVAYTGYDWRLNDEKLH